MKRHAYILPVIVLAQFCCTSLWFAGNAVMDDLAIVLNLASDKVGDLTSFVQFGFILGTLIFATLNIADRYSPSKVFFTSALFGAFFNALSIWDGHIWISLLATRFATGFALAGIYPVGMKIAADYFRAGLGKSLGYLVGALVLGSACPYIIDDILIDYAWQNLLWCTSILSIIGGFLILVLIPDGPFRKPATKLSINGAFSMFRHGQFRAAAFGYFGHMWELYTFWTFVPALLVYYMQQHNHLQVEVSRFSFLIIGIGCIACIAGGYISQKFGPTRVAFCSLFGSLLCILFAPFALQVGSIYLFILFMMIWGMLVIADSPMFSTLVALHAEPSIKGSAMTLVNCIGFALTILSIQVFQRLAKSYDLFEVLYVLAIGPICGLLFIWYGLVKGNRHILHTNPAHEG